MAPMSLPPGFRFHPTDEELVNYYLDRKITGRKIELQIIPEVDLYKCEPWDLPDKSYLPSKDMEWYFFSPSNRKYPNGSRTNRATEAGYWKATGKDRTVKSQKMKAVGMKKTLVFYKGRAPQGSRTNWVMHEYRLLQSSSATHSSLMDSYALCRVFNKNINTEEDQTNEEQQCNYKLPSDASSELTQGTPTHESLPQLPDEAISTHPYHPLYNPLPNCHSNFYHEHMQIQDANYLPQYSSLFLEDFPQTNVDDAYHEEKFKEYMNGAVMLEDIFALCSSQEPTIIPPLQDN